MVKTFLPSFRHLVARSLKDQGFSQKQVSSMLGVTQASVSLYNSSHPRKAYEALATLGMARSDADRYAALLAEDLRRSPSYAVETLSTIWKSLLGRGDACEAHRAMYPSLEQCDICIREFGESKGIRSETIAGVTEAVRLIESSRSFVQVMPEVSVNVACLAGESESTDDVVAIPGRLVRVEDHARAMHSPISGASKHLARLLLLVRRKRPEFRAVINLRYDKKMASALTRLKLKPLLIGEYSVSGEDDPTIHALTERLRGTKADFDVVVDPGAKGIEPNAYVFGKSAMTTAQLAIEISEAYSTD